MLPKTLFIELRCFWLVFMLVLMLSSLRSTFLSCSPWCASSSAVAIPTCSVSYMTRTAESDLSRIRSSSCRRSASS
uniref:Putative secreted protein n=1 Tax=Ixodes ricinus TaxID=34613 RepID=A0A6B0U3U8_IXORI